MGTEATDMPKLGVPARRALLNAGYTRLEHLTNVKESEVMKLHGMGPKAMEVLRNALQERGLSFRDG
jgi:DNA-directed RNA polymerase alpha subunit